MLQVGAGNPKNRPLTHRHRPKFFVEINCRFVPIQNRPLEPAAVSLLGEPGDV